MKTLKPILRKAAHILVDVVFWLMMAGLGWLFLQVFVFTSFKIPSDSMEPALEAGDNVLVWKGIPGARLFNIFDTLNEEQVEIYRLPGIRRIRHNDVVVFNFPHPNHWGKVEMHIMKYYIKRCIGLPGDTIAIRNGFYLLNGEAGKVGNEASQERISRTDAADFAPGVYHAFPFDSVMGWNIRDFGPLYIPRKGDRITMDRTHYLLYHKLIAWEQAGEVAYRDSTVFLNNSPLESYTFQKNYYFMAGDKGENSQDSRYWGLLPEEYIVGKAWIIWKAKDPYTGKVRWKRTGKLIDNY
ncbi:signal peptidase I [Parabacteroides sp. PFB2-12]|nr:signal peptidase I [Parabacteroides sp. PFB2-12]MDH6391156.1 signal peptidase I [Parabacteroides sp. PFB2-12]